MLLGGASIVTLLRWLVEVWPPPVALDGYLLSICKQERKRLLSSVIPLQHVGAELLEP